MKSHTLFRTVTVRPSIPLVVDVTANNFYLESSSDKVGVAFNEQGSFQMDSGKTVELPDGDSFQKITFTNPTTTDIVLTFYAGSLRVGTRTPYVYVRPAPTYIVPSNPVITNAGYSIPNRNTKAGAVKADNLSRIIVQNPGSNGSTYIEMYLGAVQIAIIAPGESWQLETSDTIILKPNPSVGTPTGLVAAFYDSPS